MREVYFYNHYSEEKDRPTAKHFRDVFRPEGILLKESPCLCKLPNLFLPRVVLVHGDTDITSPCYDLVLDYIQNNAQTKFFLLAFSLGFSEIANQKVRTRIGNLENYVPVVGSNLGECFEEIVRLARD